MAIIPETQARLEHKIVTLAFAGYVFDEEDRDSVGLRLQFARYPGA